MDKKKFCVWAISGNEEKWAEQWAKSVLSVDPDIVVVNLTAYEDKTEEIIKSIIPEDKLIFIKFPWKKSFSEARNHVLDVMPEWVEYSMFLDMDEVFVEGSKETLNNFLSSNHEYNYVVEIDIYNALGGGGKQTAHLHYPRMFPLKDASGKQLHPRFEKDVHNQLIYPVEEQPDGLRLKLGIYHYGYALDKEAMTKKHQRSEELMRKQIENDNDDFFAHLNLAQLLRAKGDHDDALYHASEVVRVLTPKIGSGDVRFQNAYLMAKEQQASCYLAKGKLTESIKASDAALTLKADHLDSIVNLGHAYMQMQNWDRAEYWFKRYLFVRSKYDESMDQSNLILNHLNSTGAVNYYLGMIYANKNELSKAAEAFKKAYELDPYLDDVFVKYIHTLKLSGNERVFQTEINKFMYTNPDEAHIVYAYLGDMALFDANVELSKFNFYQAYNLCKNESNKSSYEIKWKALKDNFGDVSASFFDTSSKDKIMSKFN